MTNLTKKLGLFALAGGLMFSANAQNTFPATGNVGIGTTTPAYVLSMESSGTTGANHTIRAAAFTSTAGATVSGGFNFTRARGTKAAPTTVVNGDRLNVVTAAGYDGAAYQFGSAIGFFVDGVVSAGVVPSNIIFETGTTGSTRLPRLTIASSGTVRVHNLSGTGTRMVVADANGILSTQAIPTGGGGGSYWTQASGNLYPTTLTDRVGVGTATPIYRLHVSDSVGYYTTYSINTKFGNTDRTGVYGVSNNNPGYGYGVQGTGGYMGGSFYNNGTTYTGSSYGVYGSSYGSAGSRYGVYGYTYNTGDNAIGVYGYAGGATNNWAGYFNGRTFVGTPPASPTAQGTLHVENNATTPDYYTAYFNSSYVGNTDTRGIYTRAVNNPGWGYGGQFTGGYRGVYVVSQGSNYASSVYSYFEATGTTGAGPRYGIYTTAYGGSSNYGVYSAGASYSTVAWNTSDKRLKRDIQPLTNSLDKIKALKTYTYKFKHDTELEKAMNLPEEEQIGFLAQELEEVIPQAVKDIPAEIGANTPEREDDRTEWFKGVNNGAIIPVVVSAMQEQQGVIEELKNENTELRNELEAIKTALTQAGIQLPQNAGASSAGDSQTQLFQNVPNPFDGTTTIPYFINQNASSAKIVITNAATGQTTQTFEVATKGHGQLRVSASGMSSGTYTYSLIVDGQVVASKAMVLTK